MPTKIEWTNETWNPVVGCSKISEGCLNCYAEKMAVRLASIYERDISKKNLKPYTSVVTPSKYYTLEASREPRRWNGKTAFVESALEKPLHWKKPRMIFVCSMSDLFHESVPFEWIDKVMAIIALCPQHTFQILTKRPERLLEYYQQEPRGQIDHAIIDGISYFVGRGKKYAGKGLTKHLRGYEGLWPLPNLWLGVTIENEKYKHRANVLSEIPAAMRFISNEPLLSDIRYTTDELRHIDWLIIGCESGPKRRPCKLEWVRNIVSQCKAANVPVFIKQLNINGKVEHNIEKFPEDLRIREYPIEK